MSEIANLWLQEEQSPRPGGLTGQDSASSPVVSRWGSVWGSGGRTGSSPNTANKPWALNLASGILLRSILPRQTLSY